jgi:hypothetical protein
LFLVSCAGLPDQPDGWSCLFAFDKQNPEKSSFICSRIKSPKDTKEFPISDPFMDEAHCMDWNTFKDYERYVFKLRQELLNCRNGGSNGSR